MTGGGLTYFTSAYVNLRVIKDKHKCTLPIEVFYAGPHELSQEAVDAMHDLFDDVKFIDITKAAVVSNIPMNGYQIKIFSIILSSFEEVLFLDADSHPIMDPSIAFEFKGYKQKGALFWPDKCAAHTSIPEMWDVMGLPRPQWPDLKIPHFFPPYCDPREPFEFETGQMVLHKRRAWRGLMMTAFINRNFRFFFDHLVHGDKQTYNFAFNSSNTPYALSPHHQWGLGLVGKQNDGSDYFCATTAIQRNADTGDILFIHRGSSKYAWTFHYKMQGTAPPRMWSHMARHDKHCGQDVLVKSGTGRAPESVYLPGMSHACAHLECANPDIVPATTEVSHVFHSSS